MKDNNHKDNFARKWITYRPEIKLLDCTVRDGGLMNNHNFDDAVIRAVYNACVDAGIDYMEIGYKASGKVFSPSEYGAWKFCNEEDIRRIVGENDTPLKLSAMADTDRVDYKTDILPQKDSVLDLIRVACYIHQIPTAMDIIKDAHDKGYETTINLMAISAVPEHELDQALEIIAGSEVQTIYLVDSFGALYSEQTRYLIRKYLHYAESGNKQVGMHAHNNQQLAFANTIEAIVTGANWVDGSIAGLGRGAGNCATEQLLGFLHNPKFKLRPILECIQNHLEPLRSKLLWGYDIPYLITGFMNQHPRDAMKFNAGENRGNLTKFYDMIMEED